MYLIGGNVEGDLVADAVCPPTMFDDGRARVSQLNGYLPDFSTIESDRLVFSGTWAGGTFDPYAFWTNYYDAQGIILKSGHPYQPELAVGWGLNLAFDYDVTITPSSGSTTYDIGVSVFGGVISDADFTGGDGFDDWDTLNGTVSSPNVFTESGSVTLVMAPGVFAGAAMLEIFAFINGGPVTYSIDLFNFQWICVPPA